MPYHDHRSVPIRGRHQSAIPPEWSRHASQRAEPNHKGTQSKVRGTGYSRGSRNGLRRLSSNQGVGKCRKAQPHSTGPSRRGGTNPTQGTTKSLPKRPKRYVCPSYAVRPKDRCATTMTLPKQVERSLRLYTSRLRSAVECSDHIQAQEVQAPTRTVDE